MCNCFLFTSLMLQNLYQYAFAFSTIQGSFLIYSKFPRTAVPCSELVLGDGRLGHVFAVEEDENGIDPAALFAVTMSESSENIVESIDADSNMQTVENNLASTGSNDTEPVHPSCLGICICVFCWHIVILL